MRFYRLLLPLLSAILLLSSCKKELNVNADWTETMVVYGLLDQTLDTNYIKITKAFLGPGNAIDFAKIADSSQYKNTLEVRLDEYSDGAYLRSINLDTITIHNKQAGDSVFYFPEQQLYYTTEKLNQNHLYKLFIKNPVTGKVVTSETRLVHDFEIFRPQSQASFPPGFNFQVKWAQAKEGKRYQLLIRFHYIEFQKSNPSVSEVKHIDWILFNNIKSPDVATVQPFDLYFPADGFYAVVASRIAPNPNVTRNAWYCDFIFTVAAADLNTYMEVTEPTLSLVQEKPTFTNIKEGDKDQVGLFSARFSKHQTDTLFVSQITRDALKTNPLTKDLGF